MNRSAAGFTLVELVVAIGIMAILGVIGTLSFSSWQTKTKIESQMTQMFADIAEARTNAFTQKKVYGIVFQPTGYVMKNYSSEAEYGTDANAATKGTQVRSKTLKYNITKSTAGADITNTPIVFDTKGFVYNTTNALNIFANPVTVQATNCIVISMARENVGRINGTNCEIK